jgi:hypothetical protein
MTDYSDDTMAYIRLRNEAHALAMTVRRADLYRVAQGMPYRSQASKDDMALWLLRYAPDRVEQLKRP